MIYRPIKSNWRTQRFGENLACAVKDTGASFPYRTIPGAYAGNCPLNSVKLYPLLGLRGHNGEDWAAWRGEPCYHCAEFDGWQKSEIDINGGIGVDVISNEPIYPCDKGCLEGTLHYIKMRYWHFLSVEGYDGKQVKLGDLIGKCDSTGVSSGDHLHFAKKICDKSGKAAHSDNGYTGAVDFEAEFDNVFVRDVLTIKAQALSVIDLARKVIFEIVAWLNKRSGN